MSRADWTTISIPTELHTEASRHVPERARSVQEYVRMWTQIGCLVDQARGRDQDFDALIARVIEAISRK
jgi:hypothetical protein